MEKNSNTVKAINRNVRSSARKINILLKNIRGKKADIAIRNLSFARQRIALEIKKTLQSAIANAENIAQQLVRRIAFRKTMKRAMQSALRLGAKGIKVCLSGRLAGNEIARTEWLREGSVPLHTFRAEVDYGETEALTAYGIIGVKVWIYKGEIFLKDLNKNNKEKKDVTTNKNKV